MGCSCNNNRKTTSGFGTARSQQDQTPPPAPAPEPVPAPVGETQSFALIQTNGARTVYGSRLEAMAAQIRSGGTIRPE